VAWVVVALAGIAVLAVLGATMTARRTARLEQGLRDGAADLPAIPARDPVLSLSFRTRAAILVGIIFLMTVKPGWPGSLGAMAVTVAVGLLMSVGDFRGRAPAP
jgi:hypothetical protein